MRNGTFFLIVVMVISFVSSFISCSDEVVIESSNDDTCHLRRQARTVDEAKEIALGALSVFAPNSESTDSRNELSLSSCVITRALSRNGAADTLLHIINFGEDDGFAVIGGPINSEPLIAFVDSGNYNDPETSDVESFQYYMTCAANKMARLGPVIGDTFDIVPQTKTEYEWKLVRAGGKILDLKWGQGSGPNGEFEGAFCPNKIAGCGMTAGLMIMAYYQQPTSMNFTFPERDCDFATLDWSSIMRHKVKHDKVFQTTDDDGNPIGFIYTPCIGSDEDHLNLGRIARRIGYSIGATYNSNSTGAKPSRLLNYLTSVIPNSTYTSFHWHNNTSTTNTLVRAVEDKIVLVCGNDTARGNHAWIADGYKLLEYQKNTYQKRTNDGNFYLSEWELISTQVLGQGYFLHYNWGWYGSCNGFFSPNVFDVNNEFQHDLGEGDIEKQYDFFDGVIYYPLSRIEIIM